MNEDVNKIKELIERVKLTPEDIRELCIAHYAEKWDRETAEEVVTKVTFEFTTKVAKAQLNKVLNDKDLALIDRNPTPIYPSMVFYCKDCDKMVKNTYCNIVDENWLKVIPLAEAIKEAK